jgi:hypothetical protein
MRDGAFVDNLTGEIVIRVFGPDDPTYSREVVSLALQRCAGDADLQRIAGFMSQRDAGTEDAARCLRGHGMIIGTRKGVGLSTRPGALAGTARRGQGYFFFFSFGAPFAWLSSRSSCSGVSTRSRRAKCTADRSRAESWKSSLFRTEFLDVTADDGDI